MAISLYTPINDVSFLSELNYIAINATGSDSVEVIITGEDEIFRNTYTPFDDGRVVIYDLGKVIDPYLDYADLGSNQFEISIGGSTYSTTVIPCSVAVSESAATYVPDFFLAATQTERDTCLGRYETVTPFVPTDTSFTVLATYFDGVKTATKEFTAVTVADYAPLDVSPSLFVDESLGKLVAYTVKCGARRAKYRVLNSLPEADPAIIFRNSFGCWETIYLTGKKTQQPNYTRSSALINGSFKTYNIEEEMLWEAQTGPLRESMVEVATDLARSKAVFLLNADGTPGDEIVITACDVKASNADEEELTDLKFTYRRSAYNTGVVKAQRPPRLFDSTFNYTFG